jgi:Uncharacterized conserved protein (DUF2075)
MGYLQQAYASDGFASQYTRQTKAWLGVIPRLQHSFSELLNIRADSRDWTLLLEYPLYRLRRRIDAVILAKNLIIVVECKVGSQVFTSEDRRQVEEYALDLRDFHAKSSGLRIIPVLWSTEAPTEKTTYNYPGFDALGSFVDSVENIGAEGLQFFLADLSIPLQTELLSADEWDRSSYRPVPNVIEAATSIFAGHNVRSIANADAGNLRLAAGRLIALIDQAQQQRKRYLLILTGVPGSGKTLAGLDVVHSAVATGVEHQGDIVYLSGNTPLVVVLREALARDERMRIRLMGGNRNLKKIRSEVRARIQHINDFLQESFRGSSNDPPHEHVIVFDEAQRAWDEKQGFEKFDRSASEPMLLLELMSRHRDWCACVCLVGIGQEINSGEEGLQGWGTALRNMQQQNRRDWTVFAGPDWGRSDCELYRREKRQSM